MPSRHRKPADTTPSQRCNFPHFCTFALSPHPLLSNQSAPAPSAAPAFPASSRTSPAPPRRYHRLPAGTARRRLEHTWHRVREAVPPILVMASKTSTVRLLAFAVVRLFCAVATQLTDVFPVFFFFFCSGFMCLPLTCFLRHRSIACARNFVTSHANRPRISSRARWHPISSSGTSCLRVPAERRMREAFLWAGSSFQSSTRTNHQVGCLFRFGQMRCVCHAELAFLSLGTGNRSHFILY